MVLCDLGHFRAYIVDYPSEASPVYKLVFEKIFEESFQRTIERVADRAGRHFAPPITHTVAAPISDDNNLLVESKKRIIKQIAHLLVQQLITYPQITCWFAAPAKILNSIIKELPRCLLERLDKIQVRNFVNMHPHDIIEVFDPQAYKRYKSQKL